MPRNTPTSTTPRNRCTNPIPWAIALTLLYTPPSSALTRYSAVLPPGPRLEHANTLFQPLLNTLSAQIPSYLPTISASSHRLHAQFHFQFN